jgi:hypothetical protein
MSQTRAAFALVPRKAAEPGVIGVVIGVEPAYPREVGIGWPVLLPILLGAGVVRLLAVLIAAVLRQGPSSGGARRTPKELRRGPEFLVTEFTLREPDGTLVELESHGHLPTSALLPRDRVRAELRRQRRHDLPPLAHRLHNHTSGRVHRPHAPTTWSHLGAPLLLQAILGLATILLVATALMMR